MWVTEGSNAGQTLANNSTPPGYLKIFQYSAIIRGRIVGRIVARYLTWPQVEYLYSTDIGHGIRLEVELLDHDP